MTREEFIEMLETMHNYIGNALIYTRLVDFSLGLNVSSKSSPINSDESILTEEERDLAMIVEDTISGAKYSLEKGLNKIDDLLDILKDED